MGVAETRRQQFVTDAPHVVVELAQQRSRLVSRQLAHLHGESQQVTGNAIVKFAPQAVALFLHTVQIAAHAALAGAASQQHNRRNEHDAGPCGNHQP